MKQNSISILGRVSTGATAFALAGYLAHAIFTGSGGDESSQGTWQNAKANSVLISDNHAISQVEKESVLDQILTNSVERTRRVENLRVETEARSIAPVVVVESDGNRFSTIPMGNPV